MHKFLHICVCKYTCVYVCLLPLGEAEIGSCIEGSKQKQSLFKFMFSVPVILKVLEDTPENIACHHCPQAL
jgi:hypothetical protein